MADHRSSATARPAGRSRSRSASSAATRQQAGGDGVGVVRVDLERGAPVHGSGLVSTGVPRTMASTGGRPKPSMSGHVGQKAGPGVEGGELGGATMPAKTTPSCSGSCSPHPVGPTMTSGQGSGSSPRTGR